MGGAPSSSKRSRKSTSSSTYVMLEAASRGDFSQLVRLLASGANANSADKSGRTPLHLACAEGHANSVRLLIRHGAAVDAMDCFGNHPIHEAVLHGHKEVMDILIGSGSKWTDDTRTEMESRLCNAVYLGNLRDLKHLINAGISHNCVDYLGNSPLHIAVDNGHRGVVEFLLKSTANVDCRNLKGDSPLKIAIRKKDDFLKRMLLFAGDTLFSTIESNLSGVSFTIMQACPAPIASALLSGREIEPISRPMVSLFYSDIVGFTQLSSRLTADKVSRLLSTLVALFDRLAYLHGVQKIDVIGDAYIAATNFTEHQPDDHAARLARFAVAATAAARTVPIDSDHPAASAGRLEVRVGMHCGPCKGIVANLGAPKYSLIGKTARVAARMESSGAAGMVQCSAASARLIARQGHDIELRPRERGIDLGDGAGRARTFWASKGRRRFSYDCPQAAAERPGQLGGQSLIVAQA